MYGSNHLKSVRLGIILWRFCHAKTNNSVSVIHIFIVHVLPVVVPFRWWYFRFGGWQISKLSIFSSTSEIEKRDIFIQTKYKWNDEKNQQKRKRQIWQTCLFRFHKWFFILKNSSIEFTTFVPLAKYVLSQGDQSMVYVMHARIGKVVAGNRQTTKNIIDDLGAQKLSVFTILNIFIVCHSFLIWQSVSTTILITSELVSSRLAFRQVELSRVESIRSIWCGLVWVWAWVCMCVPIVSHIMHSVTVECCGPEWTHENMIPRIRRDMK